MSLQRSNDGEGSETRWKATMATDHFSRRLESEPTVLLAPVSPESVGLLCIYGSTEKDGFSVFKRTSTPILFIRSVSPEVNASSLEQKNGKVRK